MKRTTISLPDELAAAMSREAGRRRASTSQIVREALEARYGRTEEKRVIPFAAIGHSGARTTARDTDEILAREWTIDRIVDAVDRDR
jgi:Arc/MetJ-type ribon-helix-helix transcriptional regulator